MRQFGGSGRNTQSDKTKIVIGLAVVFLLLATVAIVLIGGSSGTPEATAVTVSVPETSDDSKNPLRLVPVLVPTRKIDSGSPLEPNMFRVEQRPQVGLPAGRIVKDFEEVKGHYARSMILAGQPLHMDFITSVRPTNALTANIPEGFRAVTISVDARSSVEGFVLPGAKVDVVWASSIRNKPGVTVIVQNAKVLSAERQLNVESTPDGRVPSTVTLLVSTEDAAKIQLASTTGSLTLSLRGDNDPGKGQAGRSITVDDLLGLSSSDPSQPRKGPEVTVRGPGGKSEKFSLEGGKLKPSEN